MTVRALLLLVILFLLIRAPGAQAQAPSLPWEDITVTAPMLTVSSWDITPDHRQRIYLPWQGDFFVSITFGPPYCTPYHLATALAELRVYATLTPRQLGTNAEAYDRRDALLGEVDRLVQACAGEK